MTQLWLFNGKLVCFTDAYLLSSNTKRTAAIQITLMNT